jgi:hypothetical protein
MEREEFGGGGEVWTWLALDLNLAMWNGNGIPVFLFFLDRREVY